MVTKKISVQIDGIEHVIASVVRLDDAALARLKIALREWGKILRREMRSRVPQGSGAFRKTIRSRFSRDKLTITTGAMRRDRAHPLAHIIEFGTAPHTIARRVKRALRLEEGFAASVQHPGQPATPFLVPAFEAAKGALAQQMSEALGLAVEDAVNGIVPPEPPDTDDDS